MDVQTLKPLYRMFNSVPGRYDLMNRVLTLGMDQLWRKKAAVWCMQDQPWRVLDLCTGTGDLVMHFCRHDTDVQELVALDFSESMLERACRKAEKKDCHTIRFVQANVSSMPFPDGHFDVVGTAFAFRNLVFRNPLRDAFLAEIRRILKEGGRFIVVETSQPDRALLRFLFRIYLRLIVQGMGGLLSGNRGAYSYLAYSAAHFHGEGEVRKMMSDAGYVGGRSQRLLGGMIGLYEFCKGK